MTKVFDGWHKLGHIGYVFTKDNIITNLIKKDGKGSFYSAKIYKPNRKSKSGYKLDKHCRYSTLLDHRLGRVII